MSQNIQDILDHVESTHTKAEPPKVQIGDTVDVHCRIIEGEKQRVQVFSGVIIAIRGHGMNRMITVRRIVANEGVERIFPMHSPNVVKIELKRHGHVRRAKLYYLRDRVGKKRRLRDRRRGLDHALISPNGKRRDTKAKTAPAPAQTDEPQEVEAAE